MELSYITHIWWNKICLCSFTHAIYHFELVLIRFINGFSSVEKTPKFQKWWSCRKCTSQKTLKIGHGTKSYWYSTWHGITRLSIEDTYIGIESTVGPEEAITILSSARRWSLYNRNTCWGVNSMVMEMDMI